MNDDRQLLGEYRQDRSESAFGELVTRHIDLVYAAALRMVNGDRSLAEDVTQTVFIDLARKAGSLPADVLLPGWLYRHACFTASKAVRTERRRLVREQIALEMNAPDQNTDVSWERIVPHLDDSLSRLNSADRDAIVLRFLKQQDLAAVGSALGVSEDAAQKRVGRALEKLRGILTRRGVALSAAALGSALAAHTLVAAPVGLAVSIASVSVAAGAAAGTGAGLTLKLMAMTKLQIAAAGAILAAGIATPLLLQHQSLNRLREENARMTDENQSLRQRLDQLAPLAAENQRLSNLVARANAPVSATNQQLNDLLRLRNEVTRLRSDTNGPSPGGMATMLKDPAVKTMIREQQRAMFSATVDKHYADIFAALHLPPEQAATLKELIVKRSLQQSEFGMSAMEDTDPASRLARAREYEKDKAAVNDEIKQLLGGSYDEFAAYDKTVPDRVTFSQFKDQLAGTSTPLTGDQEKQLLSAVLDEIGSFKAQVNWDDHAAVGADFASYLNGDKWNQWLQDQDHLKQRFLARGQEVLSPDQLAVFETFITSAQQSRNAQLQMGLKMFIPKTGR